MPAPDAGDPAPFPTTLERTSATEIVIRRAFRAPASLVFTAWTQPEYVMLWWAPHARGVTMQACEADVRVGGSYRYVLVHPHAGPMAFAGTYREVARVRRLVYTQVFEPVLGKPMPGEALVTVTLDEHDGLTTLVSHERYPSVQALEMALSSGMEDGMRETFGQLEALLAHLRH